MKIAVLDPRVHKTISTAGQRAIRQAHAGQHVVGEAVVAGLPRVEDTIAAHRSGLSRRRGARGSTSPVPVAAGSSCPVSDESVGASSGPADPVVGIGISPVESSGSVLAASRVSEVGASSHPPSSSTAIHRDAFK